VRNTPRILGSLRKAAARRRSAAFAQIGLVVLVELGMHNPLAAAIGRHGESAGELARRLLAPLPKAALVAAERAQVAQGELPALRVSLVKLWALLRPLWRTLALCADLLEEWQKQEMTERFHRLAQGDVTPRRRARSCPRAVRQPIGGWPRLLKNESWTGETTFHVH